MSSNTLAGVTDMIGEITQSLIAVLVIGGTMYIVASGHTVPPELWGTAGVVVGYFFTKTNTRTVERAVDRAVKEASNGSAKQP